MREWEACSALTKRKLQHLILDEQSGRICLSAFPDSESVFVFPPLPSMALGSAVADGAARGCTCGLSQHCLMKVSAPPPFSSE